MDIYVVITNLRIPTLNYAPDSGANFHLNSMNLGFESGEDLHDYLAVAADDSSGLLKDLLLAKIAQLRYPQDNQKYVKLSIAGDDLIYSGRERDWNSHGIGVRTPSIFSSKNVNKELKSNMGNRPRVLEHSDEIAYWINSWHGDAFIEISIATQCLPELFSTPLNTEHLGPGRY